MTTQLGSLARDLALPYYDDALPAHDRFHANRVESVALRLADECEGSVRRDVLSAAAWLHDIGRPLERTGEIRDHGDWASREATRLLDEEGVAGETVDAIGECIAAHSIRASSPSPESVEAKLLFDADKLDATGARGVVRLACIVGERSGRTGESYAVIDDAATAGLPAPDGPDVALLREWARERLDGLFTDPGRRLGETRWAFMQAFFARFEDELEGDGQ